MLMHAGADGSGSDEGDADACAGSEAGVLPTQEAPVAEEEGWLLDRMNGRLGGVGVGHECAVGAAEWEGTEDGMEGLCSQQGAADGQAAEECSQQVRLQVVKIANL